MQQQTTTHAVASSPTWDRLELFVREHIQRFIPLLSGLGVSKGSKSLTFW
jgi:hypothetical protein